MKIRVLGSGWYGCHLSLSMLERGHDVEVHESAPHVFAGASGANPARCHIGPHYPRSQITRAFCRDHAARFMKVYGHLTRAVPVNIYAIADKDSLVDFGTYVQILRNEIDLIPVYDPREFGLRNVEGAIMTGERHVVIRKAREHFTLALGKALKLNTPANASDPKDWDLTIDATFCALEPVDVDRYEPCLTAILGGPTDKAVTIMDGPFGGIYPWDEHRGLNSLTSAKYTPLARCATWDQANDVLNGLTEVAIAGRIEEMRAQMEYYWPESRNLYSVVGHRVGIRAMPKSAADARIVDVVRVDDRTIRVRAGKIDAVFQAEALVLEMIEQTKTPQKKERLEPCLP